MKTTKVFRSGNSQAVRLPKDFRFDVDEVEIRKKGDGVILLPKKRKWKTAFWQVLGSLDKDFRRPTSAAQIRDELDSL